MRVEIRLFATLAAFLPPGSLGGATVLEVPEGSRVHDVLRRLGVPVEMERVALVNGREADPANVLGAEDIVTVFPPLAGGSLR